MKLTLNIVTNGTEYAYWDNTRGVWKSTKEIEGRCLIDDDDARDVLRSFGDPAWFAREAQITIGDSTLSDAIAIALTGTPNPLCGQCGAPAFASAGGTLLCRVCY